MKSSYVSSRKGFFEACLTLYTATFSLRSLNEDCARISLKALERESAEVSVGKVSMVALSVCERRVEARDLRLSGLRARRATARFPCEGWARIRAMPAPWAESMGVWHGRRGVLRAYGGWPGADEDCEACWCHNQTELEQC